MKEGIESVENSQQTRTEKQNKLNEESKYNESNLSHKLKSTVIVRFYN